MNATRRLALWTAHEFSRWMRPGLLLAALALALLIWALPLDFGAATGQALDRLNAELGAPAAALRWLLLSLPLPYLLWRHAERAAAARTRELSGSGAWPGTRFERGLARCLGTSAAAGLWLLLGACIATRGLAPLAQELYFAEPPSGALFGAGEARSWPLPEAPGATSLAVSLTSLPRSSPEVLVELALDDGAGTDLGRTELLFAGRRRVRLPWTSQQPGAPGAAPARLTLVRRSGGAGVLLSSPALAWLGPERAPWRATLALAARALLAFTVAIGLVELWRTLVGSGYAVGAALASLFVLGFAPSPLELPSPKVLFAALDQLARGIAPEAPTAPDWLWAAGGLCLLLLLSAPLSTSEFSAAEPEA